MIIFPKLSLDTLGVPSELTLQLVRLAESRYYMIIFPKLSSNTLGYPVI